MVGRMPSGVATAGEAGIEAALVGVLRCSRGAVLAVARSAVLVTAPVVTVLAVAVVCVIVACVIAELGIRSAHPIRVEPGREVASTSERVAVVTAGTEAVTAGTRTAEAVTTEAVPTTASAGERRLFVPAEGAGDLLE